MLFYMFLSFLWEVHGGEINAQIHHEADDSGVAAVLFVDETPVQEWLPALIQLVELAEGKSVKKEL